MDESWAFSIPLHPLHQLRRRRVPLAFASADPRAANGLSSVNTGVASATQALALWPFERPAPPGRERRPSFISAETCAICFYNRPISRFRL